MDIIKFNPYYKAVFSGYLQVGSNSAGITTPITNLLCEVDGENVYNCYGKGPFNPTYYTGIQCLGPTMIQFIIGDNSINKDLSYLTIGSFRGSNVNNRKALINPDFTDPKNEIDISPLPLYESPWLNSVTLVSNIGQSDLNFTKYILEAWVFV